MGDLPKPPALVLFTADLARVAAGLRLSGAALFRLTETYSGLLAEFGRLPGDLQTLDNKVAAVRQTTAAELDTVASQHGLFVLSLADFGSAQFLLLAFRDAKDGLLRHSDINGLPALYRRLLEYEHATLRAESLQFADKLELVSASTNALLKSLEPEGSQPSFEATLAYLLKLFSFEHGTIWELHDCGYLTLEAVTNCDARDFSKNCLRKGEGLVWRALQPNSPKIQEIGAGLKASDLSNAHLFDLYNNRHIYLIRLGDLAHPCGVACLAGPMRQAQPPSPALFESIDKFLAHELRSRRTELSNRLLTGLHKLLRDDRDVRSICQAFAKQLLETIDCQGVSIFLCPNLDHSSTIMRLVASHIAADETPSPDFQRFASGAEIAYPISERSITGRVATLRAAHLTNQVSSDPVNSFTYREVAATSSDSWLGVPILTPAGECIGVLRCAGKMTTIHNHRATYVFDGIDKQLVASAASTLAPFLQHKQVTEELRLTNDRLETADRIRQHEMRGALQLISTQAEFVLKYLEDASATSKKRRLETIVTNVYLCTTLLTSTTLPSTRRFRTELAHVDLRKLLLALVEVAKYQIEARSPSQISQDPETSHLVLTTQPFMVVDLLGTAPLIVGHRDLLQRAFYNIASNAVKYAKQKDKGRLVMTIETLPGDQEVCVQFRDSGIGVADDEADRIFLGRFRGRESRNRPGEGLGLKIAKAIVELHGGRLKLVSARDPTIFEVVLPLALSPREKQ